MDDQFLVYPNPARDLLYVDSPIDTSGEILNLQGQIIQRVYLKNNSPIDVSGLGPGVYLLRISGSSHTYKVVIY
ncbi:MAG: T9SS type A sorting domain-containing protein [Saprospiraceae bacterium]|uniref:T9SS type A sorting domain-containing protein n=1 Tax=Candidatus Opimibacter skivensis TaxID=2982028 RepID=A0A9D7XSL8_9BACT|nr:T9SS type A sorting domain-containing protein [Candidatus Opimibacter skivensis]